MGRPRKQIDDMTILAMRGEGKKLKEISMEMQISATTLSRHISALKYQKNILTMHRELQGFQLTMLQARILDAVDLTNFEATPLNDLLQAFHLLTKAEKAIQGKEESFKVRGLIGHLVALEKTEKEGGDG